MSTAKKQVHPGKILGNELAELGLTALAFSRLIDVPTNRITELLRGRRSITPDTALRLRHFLGTTAMYWLNLQSQYDLVKADKALRHKIEKLPSVKGIRASPPKD